MYRSLLANILLLLSVFHLAIAAPEKYPEGATLVVRQQAAAPADPCIDYEIIANRSVIGTNSSYRTAFLQKSSTGTIFNARMFTEAQLKLPSLTADTALNNQCGNKTQNAIDGAATNFTQGIVAQFTTEGLPVGIKAGPEVILVCVAICALMSGVWIFSP